MKNSTEISKYITDNIMSETVVDDAIKKFNISGNQLESLAAIKMSLIPIRAQMAILDGMRHFAKEGLAMIEDSRGVL